MGCALSSLPVSQFHSTQPGGWRMMRNTGFWRGGWSEGNVISLVFRHFDFAETVKQSLYSGFYILLRKAVQHFHFSVIHFLDHPRQFKILGLLSGNAVHLGTCASCFLNMRAQECKVIFILAQVKYNSESNYIEAKLSVVLPLPIIYFF